MKNKGFNMIFILAVTLFIVDIITTMWNSSLMHYLETNPIYRATGTIIPIILLNVFIFVVLYWFYMREKVWFNYKIPLHKLFGMDLHGQTYCTEEQYLLGA